MKYVFLVVILCIVILILVNSYTREYFYESIDYQIYYINTESNIEKYNDFKLSMSAVNLMFMRIPQGDDSIDSLINAHLKLFRYHLRLLNRSRWIFVFQDNVIEIPYNLTNYISKHISNNPHVKIFYLDKFNRSDPAVIPQYTCSMLYNVDVLQKIYDETLPGKANFISTFGSVRSWSYYLHYLIKYLNIPTYRIHFIENNLYN